MASLFDYDLINNEVFYRCWHILEYIEKHPNLPPLEEEAIKATIMEALVAKNLIDPTKQSLDFKNLQIVDDTTNYCYEKHPRVCGIPLWMKEKFRHKAIYILGGEPISMRLSRPPSKRTRSCVYDPNYAVSSIFSDATFIEAIYDSPTRPGVRLDKPRPFVEVEIDGVNYLVDVLTKRILRSDWFKEEFNMEERSRITVSKFSEEQQERYQKITADSDNYGEMLHLLEPLMIFRTPEYQEMKYEFEQTKINFPEAWARAEEIKKEIEAEFMDGSFTFFKKRVTDEKS